MIWADLDSSHLAATIFSTARLLFRVTASAMVEGHSVHRVASLHRKKLCGRKLKASSPNGRFAAGAAAIDGKPFRSIEAVGKVRALY